MELSQLQPNYAIDVERIDAQILANEILNGNDTILLTCYFKKISVSKKIEIINHEQLREKRKENVVIRKQLLILTVGSQNGLVYNPITFDNLNKTYIQHKNEIDIYKALYKEQKELSLEIQKHINKIEKNIKERETQNIIFDLKITDLKTK
jgi:hypothetical protein